MRKGRVSRHWRLLVLPALVSLGLAPAAFAESSISSSDHYQVMQTEFGSGSTTQEGCSSAYCAKASIGSMVAGSSSDGKHTASFGPVTGSDPLLEVIVGTGDSSLGVLSSSSTSAATMTVHVRSYLSSGYTLQIIGNPPKYGSHTLNTLSSPTGSTPGTEQFGINAVANTTPSVGADPLQVPDDQISFGTVNDNYKTANKFMYHSGDTVAHSDSSSGETDYTISMIINISDTTPSGHYSGDFSAVVIPVY